MLNLSEVDKLHAKYLIGYWRKSFFARSTALVNIEDDPPIVNELSNLLFWTDRNFADVVDLMRHADGLNELILNMQHEVELIMGKIKSGEYRDDPTDALESAKQCLETANYAKELLEVMRNA